MKSVSATPWPPRCAVVLLVQVGFVRKPLFEGTRPAGGGAASLKGAHQKEKTKLGQARPSRQGPRRDRRRRPPRGAARKGPLAQASRSLGTGDPPAKARCETPRKRAVPERPFQKSRCIFTFSPKLRRWAAVAINAPAGLGASPDEDAKKLRSTMSLAMLLLQMLIQDTPRFERTTRAALMMATERPRCPNPVRSFHMPRPCVLRGELFRAPMMRADIR